MYGTRRLGDESAGENHPSFESAMRPLSVSFMVAGRGPASSRPASTSRFTAAGGMLAEPDFPDARRNQRISWNSIFVFPFFTAEHCERGAYTECEQP